MTDSRPYIPWSGPPQCEKVARERRFHRLYWREWMWAKLSLITGHAARTDKKLLQFRWEWFITEIKALRELNKELQARIDGNLRTSLWDIKHLTPEEIAAFANAKRLK